MVFSEKSVVSTLLFCKNSDNFLIANQYWDL